MQKPSWLEDGNVHLARRRAWIYVSRVHYPHLLEEFRRYKVPFQHCKHDNYNKTGWRIRVPRMVYDLACVFYANDGYSGMTVAEFIGRSYTKF